MKSRNKKLTSRLARVPATEAYRIGLAAFVEFFIYGFIDLERPAQIASPQKT